jgi:hypothetical protein
MRKKLLEAGIKDADYIGDGVYVGNDGYQIWLYTEGEMGIYTRIALDNRVMEALLRYNKLFKTAQKMGVEIFPHLNKEE